MTDIWKNAPLIRLLLPFTGGILLGIYASLVSYWWLLPFSILFILLLFLLLATRRRPTLRKELLFGLLTYITLVFAGINLIIFKTSKNQPSHYTNHLSDTYQHYILTVTEIPKEKPNSIQITGEIVAVKDDSAHWTPTCGNALLYFYKDSLSKGILQGDQLLLSSVLQDISPPLNPGQFNYKQYLSFHQIYQQGYVQQGDWTLLKTGGFSFVSYTSSLRDWLLNCLEEHGLTDNELAVASALILGYKEDLDHELKHSYSSAGATHVLAVSGLHVGIIFLAVNFILGVFDKREKLVFLRLTTLLFVLWFYATLTGLSPSVVRAATMFSFVAIGKAFDRDSNIYNTLAGSALVLLIYNPYLIMEVGFQLSYLAVLGIVYFQKTIYKLLYIQHRLGNYIWAITSVSIAAQLTTFPLGLLYFHQFPTYFFISNLIVIPGAVLIIGLGLMLFLFSWLPVVATFLGTFLSLVIYGMNSVVKSIDLLPASLIEGISISILECWMIYSVILLIALSKETRRLRYLNYSLMVIILLLILDLREDYLNRGLREVVIYNVKNEPNINFIDGQSNILICNTSLMEDRSTMLFNIKHHWDDLDLSPPTHFNLNQSIQSPFILAEQHYYLFSSLSLYHLSEELHLKSIGEVDILYISAPNYIPVEDVLSHVQPQQIVLGNGCHWRFVQELEKLGIQDYHNIKKQGAYVKSL